MATKPVMATAPVIVLAYDRIFCSRNWKDLWREQGRYHVALFATWLILPLLLYAGQSEWRGSAGFGTSTTTWDVYAVSQPPVILRYLRLALSPEGLCLDYTWPVARGFREIAPAMTTVVALILATVWLICRGNRLCFLGVWFFGILSMTSSVLPVADLAEEHRMYLPLIAVIALVVIGGHWALFRIMQRHPDRRLQWQLIVGGVVLLSSFALAKTTVARNADYHDKFQMWLKIADQRPHNYRALTVLSGLYLDQGETATAVALAEEVVRNRDPLYFSAHNALGRAYYAKGRDDLAWQHAEKALQLYAHNAEACQLMGLIRYRQGKYPEAEQLFSKAVHLDADNFKSHHNLGLALMHQERWPEAGLAFRRAMQLQPDYIESIHGLGFVLAKQANYGEAIAMWRRALVVNPGFFPSRYDLAWILATAPVDHLRNGDEAMVLVLTIIKSERTPSVYALEILAAAYAETGRYDLAVETSTRVQELPVGSGTLVMPQHDRSLRLALYQAGKPYRMGNSKE
jgi:tetratricopeptide (TPR) repeat protein